MRDREADFAPEVWTYQAVELGHRALAAGLADVPDLDAALAPCVHVAGGVADGDSAHHLAMAQRVDLASVTRDARAYECVWREGHGLHLSVRTNVKRISPAEGTGKEVKPEVGRARERLIRRFGRGGFLRFSSGDGREARRQARSSHVRVRVKPRLWEQGKKGRR